MFNLLRKLPEIIGLTDYEEEGEEELIEEHINDKVVKLKTQPQKSFTVISLKPSKFEEAKEAGDMLKHGNTVVLNISNLDEIQAKRVVDFVNGVTYGLNGSSMSISHDVIICAPNNIALKENNKYSFGEVSRNEFRPIF